MPFVRHQTLTPSTVAMFTLTGNPSQMEILSRNGLGEVYVSYDGTANPANVTGLGAAAFEAAAVGDQDGDGTLSITARTGMIQPSGQLTLSTQVYEEGAFE
jgi:hypothetical protein